jgi:hypothetical protein
VYEINASTGKRREIHPPREYHGVVPADPLADRGWPPCECPAHR